jgi:hypothetical protein
MTPRYAGLPGQVKRAQSTPPRTPRPSPVPVRGDTRQPPSPETVSGYVSGCSDRQATRTPDCVFSKRRRQNDRPREGVGSEPALTAATPRTHKPGGHRAVREATLWCADCCIVGRIRRRHVSGDADAASPMQRRPQPRRPLPFTQGKQRRAFSCRERDARCCQRDASCPNTAEGLRLVVLRPTRAWLLEAPRWAIAVW